MPLSAILISPKLIEPLAVSLADVEGAVARVAKIARRTPLIESRTLSKRLGGRVLVKSEGFQRTNSFKVRGLYNLLAQVPPADLANGVITRSSGNLGKSLAAVAVKLGVPCTLILPVDAPPLKVESARLAGARIVTFNRFQENGDTVMAAVAKERGALMVQRGEDPEIVAGHGTVGLEIGDDCAEMKMQPDMILVPCGTGSLTAGIAVVYRALHPKTEVVACQAAGHDRVSQAAASNYGRFAAPSICDTLMAAKNEGHRALAMLDALNVRSVGVYDTWIPAAMKALMIRFKLVAEPSGAIALAALMSGQIRLNGRTAVVVLTGANVDSLMLSRALTSPDFTS